MSDPLILKDLIRLAYNAGYAASGVGDHFGDWWEMYGEDRHDQYEKGEVAYLLDRIKEIHDMKDQVTEIVGMLREARRPTTSDPLRVDNT